MARTEARILTSIWTDATFLAMSSDAQRAYMFLLSQPDLSYAGVLPLRVRRWASTAAGLTTTVLAEALRELERNRFILADRDTEELLIRSLLRGDGVYRQPNLVKAARRSLAEVVSPVLRAAVLVEVKRCLELAADNSTKGELVAMVEVLATASADPSLNPTENPSAKASSDPTANPLGEGGVVTAVTTVAPLPVPPNPEPLPPAAAVALRGEPTAQTIVAEWINSLPGKAAKRVTGQIASHVKALLGEGFDPDQVREGLAAWQAHGQTGPSLLPSFVHQIANGGSGARASPKRSTTDDRVTQAQEVGRALTQRLGQEADAWA